MLWLCPQMPNIFNVLQDPTPVDVKTPDDLLQLVERHQPKAVSITWRSKMKPDVLVKHRVRCVACIKTVKGSTLITIKKSRRQYRSFYIESVEEVTVD